MLTIGQLAAYAGVTVRAVRHYHQIGLLPEPERDASGYRRYGATAVVSLIKIRTLANAGVPLSQIGQMLEADASTFAEAVQRIDSHLRDEIERLETSRKQIAQLAAGDSLALPPEVISYLDRLREIGASERMVEAERDGWILVAARWPDRIRESMPAKLAQLDDPQLVRLYRVLSEIFDSDAGDDPRLEEAADIMAGLAEQAYASGEINLGEVAHDDLPFDLLDALAVESDPRAERLLDLMRERGWAGWTRLGAAGGAARLGSTASVHTEPSEPPGRRVQHHHRRCRRARTTSTKSPSEPSARTDDLHRARPRRGHPADARRAPADRAPAGQIIRNVAQILKAEQEPDAACQPIARDHRATASRSRRVKCIESSSRMSEVCHLVAPSRGVAEL